MGQRKLCKKKRRWINRIVTHADLDGLASAVFLYFGLKFSNNKFILDDRFKIEFLNYRRLRTFEFEETDAVLDLPKPDRFQLWFDHHSLNSKEILRTEKEWWDPSAPSTADLVWQRFSKFMRRLSTFHFKLHKAVNIIDSANFSRHQLLNPDFFGQLSRTLRTRNFRADRRYLSDLFTIMIYSGDPQFHIETFSTFMNRKKYHSILDKRAEELFNKHATDLFDGKLIILDLTEEKIRFNRYITSLIRDDFLYEIQLFKDDGRVILRIGKNIFKKEQIPLDLGLIARKLGGGGHDGVGAIVAEYPLKNQMLQKLIDEVRPCLVG